MITDKQKEILGKNTSIDKHIIKGKKYDILTDDTIKHNGVVLFRIQATENFGKIKEGRLGGYIENESNLSRGGVCWVDHNAKVYGNATIGDAVIVRDNAEVFGNARIRNYVQIKDNAKVYDDVWVSDRSVIKGNAEVFNYAKIKNKSVIYGQARIHGKLSIINKSPIGGNVDLSGSGIVSLSKKFEGNLIYTLRFTESFDDNTVKNLLKETRIFKLKPYKDF